MGEGHIHIGTSGWHYQHWVGTFYPAKMPTEDFLSYYTRFFSTVEINSTFYHLPSRLTIQKWREGTPRDFLFSCKVSRFITHMKKLNEPKQSVKQFFKTIEILGNKLGPVLFQLPPRWHRNTERLKKLLVTLPKGYRYVFEFRDESWFSTDTYQTLAEHNTALCIYNLAGFQSSKEVTADFIYIRLHGPTGPYQGSYNKQALKRWAKQCHAWSQEGKDVYCYFDNDERGHAALDALTLKNMMKQS